MKNEKDKIVNINTGDTITVEIPIGSSVITPAQKKARIEHMKDQEKKLLRRKANDELGIFYFLRRQNELKDLSPENAGRLIYLLTYLSYDTGAFMMTQRTPMYKSDLESVLGVSKKTTQKFWKEVSDSYIKETDNNGIILINSDAVRGRLPKEGPNDYEKCFISMIRRLYHATKPTRHKYLGYIFQALQFLNREYNILCSGDIEETDLDKIEPLSILEFCEILGISKNHFYKVKNAYSKITFHVDDQEQYFLSFVSNGTSPETLKMFVNPRIVYSGSDYRKVEVLEIFSKMKPQKTKKSSEEQKNDRKSLSKSIPQKKKIYIA